VRRNIENVLKELNLVIHVIKFHVKRHLDNVSGVRIPKRFRKGSPEIVKLFEAALADMKKQGAEIVEGVKVEPAVSDRFAPLRCATRPGARQRPLRDAEIDDGKVSWRALPERWRRMSGAGCTGDTNQRRFQTEIVPLA
jgi:hypothetical protein